MFLLLKSLTYGNLTTCVFLSQKALGKLEQTSWFNFSWNLSILYWRILQVSCCWSLLNLISSFKKFTCILLLLIKQIDCEIKFSFSNLAVFCSILLRKLNLTGCPKWAVVIPSSSVIKGYYRCMNGNPSITLLFKFLTRTKGVLKQTLSLQTWALLISYLIIIWLPLLEFNLSVDFSKYFDGINLSWIQFKSAPVSTKTIT